MNPPDPGAVLDRGLRAQELLQNSTFLAVIDDLSNYNVTAMVASPPGEASRAAREHHHLMHFAVCEIVQTLQGYAATAVELERSAQDDIAEEEQNV